MPQAIETVVGYLSDAAAAGAQALTPFSPQSFNVRATNGTTTAHMESIWGCFEDPGYLRIRSPRLHDDVNGIEVQVAGTDPSPLVLDDFSQTLFSQDSLTVEAFFTAVPTATHYSFGAMQVYYDDLPGVSGNYLSWAAVAPRIQSYMGVIVEPISAAALGDWGTGVTINSTQDVFKANGAYALLGYLTPTLFPAWSILGTDLGNLYVGGPGSIRPEVTRSWFRDMDEQTGIPSIPVINSQNKGATTVQVAGNVVGTTYPLTLFFAYLGPWSGV